jgi:hypothetical protein
MKKKDGITMETRSLILLALIGKGSTARQASSGHHPNTLTEPTLMAEPTSSTEPMEVKSILQTMMRHIGVGDL